MELKDALAAAVENLEAAGVGSPRLNAEILLMFALGVDRAYLYAHPERDLSGDEAARFEEALIQRETGMPAQYITGHQEFWGLDFLVSPAVLIPRPETEHLVETVLELAHGVARPRLVDVGTGSGCIALALAHDLKDAEVFATDLSLDALEVARANAGRLQLDDRVTFLHCDVLQPISSATADSGDASATLPAAASLLRGFDFVVSNPPYVGLGEADKVQKSVRDFEPHMAVFGGEMGLNIFHTLIDQAAVALKPGGWLAMEMGYSMRDAVVGLLSTTLWEDVRVVPDLQGIPRVVAARRK